MPTLTDDCTLFINGSNSVAVADLTLRVTGSNFTIDAGVDLTLVNTQLGTTNTTFLLIRGDGLTNGGLPYFDDLNLYLERNTAEACTLYLLAPGEPVSKDMTLFVTGAGLINLGVTLVVPSTLQGADNSARLSINGY